MISNKTFNKTMLAWFIFVVLGFWVGLYLKGDPLEGKVSIVQPNMSDLSDCVKLRAKQFKHERQKEYLEAIITIDTLYSKGCVPIEHYEMLHENSKTKRFLTGTSREEVEVKRDTFLDENPEYKSLGAPFQRQSDGYSQWYWEVHND